MTLPAVAVVASPRGGGGVGSAFGVARALGGPLGPPWDLLFCEKCEETWKVHY